MRERKINREGEMDGRWSGEEEEEEYIQDIRQRGKLH